MRISDWSSDVCSSDLASIMAIADPGTTAVWEQALDMIEAGQLTLDVFIGKQAAWISQLIAQYGNASLSIKAPQGPTCPQCGAPTRERDRKSTRLNYSH